MMNHWRPEQMLGLRLWRDCKHPEGGGCVDFYPVASDPRLVLVTDGLISLLSLKALFWWLCEIQSIAFAVFCLSSFQQCGGCFRCWCTNAAHLVENQAGIEGCMTSCIRWSMLSLRALGLLLTLRSLRPLTCTLTPALSTDHLISLFFKIVQIFLTPASPTSSLVYFFSFLLSLLCQRKEWFPPPFIHVDLSLRLCSIICFISLTSSGCFVKWQNLNNLITSLQSLSKGKYSMGFGVPGLPSSAALFRRDLGNSEFLARRLGVSWEGGRTCSPG